MHLVENSAQQLYGCILEPQRLKFTRKQKDSEWVDTGRTLLAWYDSALKREDSIQWAFGDWLIVGATLAGTNRNGALGSAFEPASKITGFQLERLRTYYRVAFEYEPDARHPKLNWSIHRQAMRLIPEIREAALCKFERTQMTLADVFRYIDGLPDDQLRAHQPRTRLVNHFEHEGDELPIPPVVEAPKAERKRYEKPYHGQTLVKCPCGCEHVFPVKGNKVKFSHPTNLRNEGVE